MHFILHRATEWCSKERGQQIIISLSWSRNNLKRGAIPWVVQSWLKNPLEPQSFFYSHTHNSPCAPWMLLGCWRTNKMHPEHGLGQGHMDRHWAERGQRNWIQVQWEKQGVQVCSGQLHKVLDGAGREPELRLHRQGDTPLTVHHLPFFLISYRSNNQFLVHSSGRTVIPSLWDFPGRIPEGCLEHQLFCWLWPAACSSWGSDFNMAKLLAAKRNLSAQ